MAGFLKACVVLLIKEGTESLLLFGSTYFLGEMAEKWDYMSHILEKV